MISMTPGRYFQGIYRKTLLITVPLVVLSTVIILAGTLLMLRGEIWKLYEKSVLAGIEALSGQIALYGNDIRKITEVLERSRKSKDRYFVYGTKNGPAYWSEGTPDPGGLLRTGLEATSRLKASVDRKKFGSIDGILAAARPDKEHVLVLLVNTVRLQTLRRRGFVMVSLLVLASAAMVVLIMSRHLVLPLLERLEQLKASLSAFGSGRRDTRLATNQGMQDEFNEVFQGFNAMADKICSYEQEKARAAREEKAMLAQLAHDINTPMAILRANAENLDAYRESLTPDERQKIQRDMLTQCLYIQSLVDDLLTVASARVAEISVNPCQIMLDDLFDSITDTFEPVASQKGITIIADGNGLSAWADPVRTRQIITNLVKNSIVHGGPVTLIEIEAHEKADMVSIMVKDDGWGIRRHDIERLFHRFERDGKPGAGGWGLGLAIVRMLSEIQGGRCLYHGSEGGAVFEILLPARGK